MLTLQLIYIYIKTENMYLMFLNIKIISLIGFLSCVINLHTGISNFIVQKYPIFFCKKKFHSNVKFI